MALLLPVTIIFGVQNLYSGRTIEAIIVFAIGLCLSGLTILLNRSHAYHRTIRVIAFTLSGLLFYEFYIGGGNARLIRPNDLMKMGDDVVIVPNTAGVAGGVRAWNLEHYFRA